MKNPLITVLTVAVLAVGASIGLSLLWRTDDTEASRGRVVSLMPPVTETLYEIGAGDQLVGRSDWCNYPPEADGLTQCGSALTPNHEVIVRLNPTLILANNSNATARDDLRGLGHAEFLPWLSAEDMIASTRRLGQLTGHVEEANELADEMSVVLLQPQPATGPRVLLVMLPEPGKLEPVSFMRRNSVHGQMLYPAGARNAVDEDVSGVPEISMERVIELDPDMIIMLGIRDDLQESERRQMIEQWSRINPLTAVKEKRIGVLSGRHFYGAGRRLLRAVKELGAEIERLGHEQP
ncbi:MAG: helical backbone metal receptor [Planctomycetes bacterium]|nr:helical backbone metal receptor [Planctomycetota bacterium]